MEVELCRHALDRVPLALIIDDSTALVNLNYFFLRDRNWHRGGDQRWEDLPVVIPETFTREWAEWCAAQGVRGKFSVVPCPAGVGRLDEGLPLFGQRQLESWLQMCQEVITPNFDVTPEMLTHTYVLNRHTMQPLASRIWEQYEWSEFGEDEEVEEYIALACAILVRIGLTPQGVTSPGGFGGKCLPRYARFVGAALRAVTGNATPYFFQRLVTEDTVIETPVWYADRNAATAVGEIIACTHDRTGSWTGYGQVDADYYMTADLRGGRLPAVIDAGSPCVLCSHWQGMYGLHDGDRRGFRTLQTVVARLRERDRLGERTRWRRCSEIAHYACVRALAALQVNGSQIELDLPLGTPELTLRLRGVPVERVQVDDVVLRPVGSRAAFASGTFYKERDDVLVAFDVAAGRTKVTVG
jgi:hypothetical protein